MNELRSFYLPSWDKVKGAHKRTSRQLYSLLCILCVLHDGRSAHKLPSITLDYGTLPWCNLTSTRSLRLKSYLDPCQLEGSYPLIQLTFIKCREIMHQYYQDQDTKHILDTQSPIALFSCSLPITEQCNI